ncbi:MAG: hypothetical protein HC780_16870 [Leptolyngbyaceae cyanobacterium CSU_1_3]|nr:hypothetical protein [Leptolyngbyaceae cyanobacterium CSU_1_3]
MSIAPLSKQVCPGQPFSSQSFGNFSKFRAMCNYISLVIRQTLLTVGGEGKLNGPEPIARSGRGVEVRAVLESCTSRKFKNY